MPQVADYLKLFRCPGQVGEFFLEKGQKLGGGWGEMVVSLFG